MPSATYVVGPVSSVDTWQADRLLYTVFRKKGEAEMHMERQTALDAKKRKWRVVRCASEEQQDELLNATPPPVVAKKKRKRIIVDDDDEEEELEEKATQAIPVNPTSVYQQIEHEVHRLIAAHHFDCSNNVFFVFYMHQGGWIIALKYQTQFRIQTYLDVDDTSNSKNKYVLPCIHPRHQQQFTTPIEHVLHALMYVQWFISSQLSVTSRKVVSNTVQVMMLLSQDIDGLDLLDPHHTLLWDSPSKKLSAKTWSNVTKLNFRRMLLEPPAGEVVQEISIIKKSFPTLQEGLHTSLGMKREAAATSSQARAPSPTSYTSTTGKYPDYIAQSKSPQDTWTIESEAAEGKCVSFRVGDRLMGKARARNKNTAHLLEILLSSTTIPLVSHIQVLTKMPADYDADVDTLFFQDLLLSTNDEQRAKSCQKSLLLEACEGFSRHEFIHSEALPQAPAV